MTNRIFSSAVLPAVIFLSFLALALPAIDSIDRPYFDETHYVPAAKSLTHLQTILNIEHPPLAKYWIGLGIWLLGDCPLGWRIMSVIAGALCLVFIFLLMQRLFEDRRMACIGSIVVASNQLLFVQARIATLEIFVVTLMTAALLIFYSGVFEKTKPSMRAVIVTGILTGMAIATKWFAVVLLLVYLPTLFVARPWRKRLFYSTILLVAMVSTYGICFIPLLFIDENPIVWHELITLQYKMYRLQQSVHSPHPYSSEWYTWPLMLRPIWYFYDGLRGVVALGNPFTMWSGLLALGYCCYDAVWGRDRRARIIMYVFAIFLLSWAFIPRQLSFYYYYFPASLVLSVAICHVLSCLAGRIQSLAISIVVLLSVAVFCYFYPVLSGLSRDTPSLKPWMWLHTWI